MKIKYVIGIIVIIVALAIGLGLYQKQPDVKPPWIQEVRWSDKPSNAAKIESLLWAEISPYRTEYKIVNISAGSEEKGLSLRIIAVAKDSEYPDIYDFLYEEEKLVLTGYLLAAIPSQYRNDAISIALRNPEIAASVANASAPTVRRILPGTSGKFYAPKTLLSVTWDGTSALIDPDVRKVVRVWKAGGEE